MCSITESLLKSKSSKLLYLKVFSYLTVLGRFTHAVLPEYCLRPLNTSDCNLKPTPVFSYYKSGSRCEIKFWRGCPTFNKFNDEYECSHKCIGRLVDSILQKPENDGTQDGNDEYADLCSENLDTSKCGKDETTVFTYNIETEMCESAKYYGCGGNNIFDSMETCNEVCEEKNEFGNLSVPEVEKLSALISQLEVDPVTTLDKSETSKAEPENEILYSGNSNKISLTVNLNTITPESNTVHEVASSVLTTKTEIFESTVSGQNSISTSDIKPSSETITTIDINKSKITEQNTIKPSTELPTTISSSIIEDVTNSPKLTEQESIKSSTELATTISSSIVQDVTNSPKLTEQESIKSSTELATTISSSIIEDVTNSPKLTEQELIQTSTKVTTTVPLSDLKIAQKSQQDPTELIFEE